MPLDPTDTSPAHVPGSGFGPAPALHPARRVMTTPAERKHQAELVAIIADGLEKRESLVDKADFVLEYGIPLLAMGAPFLDALEPGVGTLISRKLQDLEAKRNAS